MKRIHLKTVIIWSCVVAACLLLRCDCNPSSSSDDSSPASTTLTDQSNVIDTDKDGTVDAQDNDIDGDGIANAQDSDMDGDGIPNVSDSDMDGDGIPNSQDSDIDGDGIPNASDPDIDGDGTPNAQDTDADGDGIPNESDPDIDGDGIPNVSDPDMDGDGIPNESDPDIDGDGIANDQDTDPNAGAVPQGNEATGLAVPVIDTVTFLFTVSNTNAGSVITSTEKVYLDSIRMKIDDSNIELETFSVTSFYLISSPSSQSFVSANAETEFILQGYYLDGTNEVKVAETSAGPPSPFPIQKVKNLESGLFINSQLFAAPGSGYADFINMIKDRSKKTVDYVIDIALLDDLAQGGTLELQLIIKITGKKKL